MPTRPTSYKFNYPTKSKSASGEKRREVTRGNARTHAHGNGTAQREVEGLSLYDMCTIQEALLGVSRFPKDSGVDVEKQTLEDSKCPPGSFSTSPDFAVRVTSDDFEEYP